MKHDNDNIQPRGLRRAQAAAYLGISAAHFDKQVKAGLVPAPRLMLGVALWDRRGLDALFDGPAADNDNDPYLAWKAANAGKSERYR